MPDLSADRHAILEQLKQADDAAERLLAETPVSRQTGNRSMVHPGACGSASIIWRASTESIAKLCGQR
jgi:hypothetical protein